jgi:hypothetical protein
MSFVPIPDVLDAAAQAYINARCRGAYLHDMRGELQTLNSCIELLSRAAQNPASDIVRKWSAVAKRAMDTHSRSLSDILQQMTLQDEAASTVDLGVLIQDVVKFLRNDTTNKLAKFNLDLASNLVVSTPAHKCRLSILGLSVSMLDEAATGAIIDLRTRRDDRSAYVEFSSDLNVPAPASMHDLCSASTRNQVGPLELFLAYASRWAAESGGHLQVTSESGAPTRVMIYCSL